MHKIINLPWYCKKMIIKGVIDKRPCLEVNASESFTVIYVIIMSCCKDSQIHDVCRHGDGPVMTRCWLTSWKRVTLLQEGRLYRYLRQLWKKIKQLWHRKLPSEVWVYSGWWLPFRNLHWNAFCRPQNETGAQGYHFECEDDAQKEAVCSTNTVLNV